VNQPANQQLSLTDAVPTLALMEVEAVQKALNRSRASIYRYANSDPQVLNPPYNPERLNPELRNQESEPLRFHPNEVARFARDVLRLKQVTIEVQPQILDHTDGVLQAILAELQQIRQLLEARQSPE
jgi:hypothetical protein